MNCALEAYASLLLYFHYSMLPNPLIVVCRPNVKTTEVKSILF